MKIICLFIGLFVWTGVVFAQDVNVVSFKELDAILNKTNDTTYIINFWATWCSPCVEELPHFESVREKYQNDKVQVLLVSLDFRSALESKVMPFLKKKGIRSKVLLLDEPDANSYIDKVSPQWSGAIPATLIVNGKERTRQFYEKKFSQEELFSVMHTLTERP